MWEPLETVRQKSTQIQSTTSLSTTTDAIKTSSQTKSQSRRWCSRKNRSTRSCWVSSRNDSLVILSANKPDCQTRIMSILRNCAGRRRTRELSRELGRCIGRLIPVCQGKEGSFLISKLWISAKLLVFSDRTEESQTGEQKELTKYNSANYLVSTTGWHPNSQFLTIEPTQQNQLNPTKYITSPTIKN